MRPLVLLLLGSLAAFAAEDPWTKVKDLKSGTELRIFKKGVSQPVMAKMDEATDESLKVVVKNEQVAIPKNQIDRIDSRPVSGKATTRSETKTTDPDTTPGPPGHGSRTPGTSSSTSLSLGKPDFETVYRRPAGPPKK